MRRITEFEYLMMKAHIANVNAICGLYKRIAALEERK